ncbi:hypothetical protein HDU93_008266 [Gonapodya sp. JEL0774]|nr:hypothetical protein HDU93_008266 [Gonapodya sp. JEL0774]
MTLYPVEQRLAVAARRVVGERASLTINAGPADSPRGRYREEEEDGVDLFQTSSSRSHPHQDHDQSPVRDNEVESLFNSDAATPTGARDQRESDEESSHDLLEAEDELVKEAPTQGQPKSNESADEAAVDTSNVEESESSPSSNPPLPRPSPATLNLLSILHRSTRHQSLLSARVHRNITCDGCHMSPIRGIRYMCGVCPSYDLCGMCEARLDQGEGEPPQGDAGGHTRLHPMIKLRIPVPPLANPRFSGPGAVVVGRGLGSSVAASPGGGTGSAASSFAGAVEGSGSHHQPTFPQDYGEGCAGLYLQRDFAPGSSKLAWDALGEIGGKAWCHSFSIPRQMFYACLGQLGENRNVIAEACWSWWDADGDGRISWGEWIRGVCGWWQAGQAGQEWKLEFAFHIYSLSQPYVTRTSLTAVLRAHFSLSSKLVSDLVRETELSGPWNREFLPALSTAPDAVQRSLLLAAAGDFLTTPATAHPPSSPSSRIAESPSSHAGLASPGVLAPLMGQLSGAAIGAVVDGVFGEMAGGAEEIGREAWASTVESAKLRGWDLVKYSLVRGGAERPETFPHKHATLNSQPFRTDLGRPKESRISLLATAELALGIGRENVPVKRADPSQSCFSDYDISASTSTSSAWKFVGMDGISDKTMAGAYFTGPSLHPPLFPRFPDASSDTRRTRSAIWCTDSSYLQSNDDCSRSVLEEFSQG